MPCNCDTCKKRPVPHYYDHKNLLDRLERKKDTVECANSFEDVPVQVLLDTLFTSANERHLDAFEQRLGAVETLNPEIKIFISYSKSDKDSLDVLRKHLTPMIDSGKATVWYDGDLAPGSQWDTELKRNLSASDIVLFLVSKDFLATKYIWTEEVTPTIERSKQGLVTAIPVILGPCDWASTILKDLNALPAKGKEISKFSDADEAYLEVINKLRSLIESMNQY